jgi:hypothetical protein
MYYLMYLLNILLAILLIVVLLHEYKRERFLLYYNTPENRLATTCDAIKMNPADYSREDHSKTEPAYKLYHDEDGDEMPYAQCKDNVVDNNSGVLELNDFDIKKDNYRLGAPKDDARVKRRLLSASDKYYGFNKFVANSSPVFF